MIQTLKKALYDRLKNSGIDRGTIASVMCVILLISVLSIPVASQDSGGDGGFFDDYESYATGTFPTSNYSYGDVGSGTDASITESQSFQGDKSLEIDSGGFGENVILDKGPFQSNITNVSVYMLNADGASQLRLNDEDIGVVVSENDVIVTNGTTDTVVGTVNNGWAEFKLYNITETSFEVMWTDSGGTETAGPFTVEIPQETNVGMWSNGVAYFDNIDISQEVPIEPVADPELKIDTRNYLEHNTSSPYTVYYTYPSNGTTVDVSDATGLTVNSSNTSVFTLDETNNLVVATSDTSINQREQFTAQYEGLEQSENVTVANKTVENLPILPGITRVGATYSDSNIAMILVGTLLGVVATRVASAFAGLGAFQLALVGGWFVDLVTLGVVLVSLFAALFIGLNMAANIDYTVRR